MGTGEELISRTLFVDLETNRAEIFAVGAALGPQSVSRAGAAGVERALDEIERLAGAAEFIAGHNILKHDLPFLRTRRPEAAFLRLPVIDTLPLSPLAFPENPYHRLVKDYKLVSESVNDPLADARLAAVLLRDEIAAFRRKDPGLLSFYARCLSSGGGPDAGGGFLRFFAALGADPAGDDASPALVFQRHAPGLVCHHASVGQPAEGAALAYALAWVQVAGNNSVLPPWVWRQFPEVKRVLDVLRETPCGRDDCAYCATAHNPRAQLQRYFGFDRFRAEPANAAGGSMQEDIVTAGLRGEPFLAILPTGAGKSLCFQLPALTRNFRRGSVTVVLSPLQALMKDQVDNLVARTGTHMASAINGLLTMPERADALRRLQLGDTAILYLSPEQLRNRSVRRALAQREIGAWVFDEAHCLSKWGHDFRPDYLHAGRFIREFSARQGVPPAPVFCLTATAKPDVIEEIAQYFNTELGQTLKRFEGPAGRNNLHFEVREVGAAEKWQCVFDLVAATLGAGEPAAAVVYSATREGAERLALFLTERGLAATAFHAGLSPAVKRQIQEDFLAGRVAAICATNAFGMGIDKDNVRLVVHADIPGSLENYIQEAGRAGRDRLPARCVLLYDPQDIERQFGLGASTRLSRRDIAGILRVLRNMRRAGSGDDIVLTAGELLRSEDNDTAVQAGEPAAETRVKAAIALLERGRFLERNENQTAVFQGRPLVASLDEARRRIASLNLSARVREQWLAILGLLMNTRGDEGFSADAIAGLPEFSAAPDGAGGDRDESETMRVMRTLRAMADAGLVRCDTLMSAFVRHKVQDASVQRIQRVHALEQAMLDVLRELAPDAEGWLHLHLNAINQRLLDGGHVCAPPVLAMLLRGLSLDGRTMARGASTWEMRHIARDLFRVRLPQGWTPVCTYAELRRQIASIALDEILRRIPPEAAASGELLVPFPADDIVSRIGADLALAGRVHDPHAALEHALMYLHEQGIIILHQGLAVFRQAMTIRILPEAHGRRFLKGDFRPLEEHYAERVFQVHVMAEYARLGVAQLSQALALVPAYFTMGRAAFVAKFFPGRQEMLRRATSADSYRAIVESLRHPVQAAIVGAPIQANLLVLAGPGSGKTRTVVHRCAFLLRVERVPARSILVLCFNRNAALLLRRRLRELAGDDARGVLVATYHGLAMRLLGRSFAAAARERGTELKFDELLPQATRLLRGEVDLPGAAGDEWRDRILAGYEHILVDEYQDIDEPQYAFISALAGRTQQDADRKLALLAVGDDDQSIYAFRGANVRFIRQFEADYQAERHHLTDNFRATAHLIAAANAVIRRNRDRMKVGHEIRIDAARRGAPAGGRWAALDPVAKGRVQVLRALTAEQQAFAVLTEIRRLRALDPQVAWCDFAVFARTGAELEPLRALLEHAGVPAEWNGDRDVRPAPARVREIAVFLDRLHELRSGSVTSDAIAALLPAPLDRNPWVSLMHEVAAEWRQETDDAATPTVQAIEFFHEALADARREERFGHGVFLATAHASKGMEFPHVFVLGGGWNPAADRLEEERRLFYVAMTRAMHTLCLLQRADARHPLLTGLDGDYVVTRPAPAPAGVPPGVWRRRHHVLGLEDLFLDWAGRTPDLRVSDALGALQTGAPVRLVAAPNGDGQVVFLCDEHGRRVGRLSENGVRTWGARLNAIEQARVVAMVRRRRVDVLEPGFAGSIVRDAWEIPLAALVVSG